MADGFFGQKWLVDTWLINPSSPEQRQQAVISQLLRASLADKTVTIEGIPPYKGDTTTPAEMTFLTTFGALVYTDSLLIESIEAQRGIIARQFVRNQAYSQFDQYYQDYQELRNSIRQGYRDYLEANQRFELEMAGADKRVDPLWLKAEAHVRDAWDEYQRAASRLDQESQRLANDMAPQLYQYFKRRNACRNDRCRENLDSRYRQDISKTRLGYVDPMHWLLEEKISTSENLLNTAVAAVMTGGVTLALQGLDKATGGDGGWKDKTYSYTNDLGHYEGRIKTLLDEEFSRQSSYPPSISNLKEFRDHPTTGKTVISWGRQRGLDLPAGWTMIKQSVFRQKATDYFRKNIRESWKRQAGSGSGLVPGTSSSCVRNC